MSPVERARVLLVAASLAEQRGNYAGALNAAQQALEMLEARSTDAMTREADDLLLQAWGLAGSLQRQLAQYNEAEALLQRALDFTLEKYGEAADETSLARNQLAVLHKYTGEFEKGESLYRLALKHVLKNHGEMHALAAMLYHNLGGLFHARGDFAGGEPFGLRAWEIDRALLGEDDLVTLADAAAYAGLLDGLKRFDESEPIYERVLSAYEQHAGIDPYEIAVNLNNLANVRFARGDFQGAEQGLRQALAIKEKSLGPDHPDCALTENNLGVVLRSLGRSQEAGKLFARALAIFEARLGPHHPRTVMVRGNLTGGEAAGASLSR